MNKIITFIIPSYNVEHCLRVCLDSFLINEAAGLNQLEVIIVDDGSTDGTAGVAKEYETRYPAVYRLIRKKNGGHGSAINVGSREARGKYLKVVDADDWVVTENLAELLKRLEVCEADVVLTPFHRVNAANNSREIWRMYCEKYETVYSLEQIVSSYNNFDRCLTFHGMMYRTKFYQSCGHQLSEGIFYEDQEYAAIPCCYADSIYPIDLFLYQYLVGNSQQSVAAANRIKRINDLEIVTQNILRCTKKNAEQTDTYNSAAKNYLLKKAKEAALSYYVTSCLLQPDKQKGLKQADTFTKKIEEIEPEIRRLIHKKYPLYRYMCRLHISYGTYEKILHSRLYRLIRRKQPLEKELSQN